MEGACRMQEATTNLHNFLVENPERKKLPGRARCRWKDNIKTDL
jgi:hypothetical protein